MFTELIYSDEHALWVAIEQLYSNYLNAKRGGESNKVGTDTEASTGSCRNS